MDNKTSGSIVSLNSLVNVAVADGEGGGGGSGNPCATRQTATFTLNGPCGVELEEIETNCIEGDSGTCENGSFSVYYSYDKNCNLYNAHIHDNGSNFVNCWPNWS